MGGGYSPERLATDLDQIRRRAGLSYRELSRRTGCPVSTLNDALRGRRFPRLETVLAVARACGGDETRWRDRWLAAEGGAPVAARRPVDSGPVPAELPHEVRGFAGRGNELARLSALMVAERTDAALAIVAVDGMAGVGKTALALHWAHQAAPRFPDGQLFLNLHGHHRDRAPMSAEEALEKLLRSLGAAPQRAPSDTDDLARQYRSLLAGKRVLVVLDDAVSADQVRPLLPAGPGSAVIVTSRRRLTGLVARDGARRLPLDVFSPDDAYTLMVLLLGRERVGREPDAAAYLAEVCGHLPLALRVATAYLETGRRLGIGDLVRELAGDDSLGSFGADGDEQTGVRAAFALSYRTVDDPARRLFRLLGLVPGADATAPAAAALGDVPVEDAIRCLDALAAAHLVDEHLPGRFRLHDLLRRYAAERAVTEEPEPARTAAVGRLLDWYVAGADTAARRLHPHSLRLPVSTREHGPDLPDDAAALAWLEAERANLTAVVEHSARSGPYEAAWQLADELRGFFNLRMYRHDWLATAQAGLHAATTGGDQWAAAAMHHNLGLAHSRLGSNAAAVDHFSAAIGLYERLHHTEGRANVLVCRGGVYRQLGELSRAADDLRGALEICQEYGLRACAAAALGDLGEVYRELGELHLALDQQNQAIRIFRELDAARGEAIGLLALGATFRELGRLDQALEHESRALAKFLAIGSRDGEAYALLHLAVVHDDAGRPDEAERDATRAVALAEEIGDDALTVEAHHSLAEVYRHRGRLAEAVHHYEDALGIAGPAEYRAGQVKALVGLAVCLMRLGRAGDAVEYGRRAVTLSHTGGYRLVEEQARAVLAEIGVPGPHAELAQS